MKLSAAAVLLASAVVSAVPLASAPKASKGTLEDLKHVVIFMQENRAFDHYFGQLNGIRGFNDRAHPPLPNGQPIFYQPVEGADQSYILPFYLQFDKTSTQCMPAPMMAYESDIQIFNEGRMDSWNTARFPGFGMSYFNRTDLPYYYALADAFTVGDQYFQSTFTATNPNRLHLFTGSNGLSVPNSGACLLDDTELTPGFTWETMAETLMKANVSWRVIQEIDNFDDNAFEWMAVFQNATPGSALYDLGIKPVADLVGAFEEMVASDSLPSVLWIVGPTSLSEHAENHPGDGEDLSHRLINVLSKPEYVSVYGKTAFFLNYDEGGQFFDHHWTPTPPRTPAEGESTVSTVGELTLVEEFGIPPNNPIGLGFRVPFMIISPWTRGHLVYSEVSDHVSIIKLIEKRFGVHCPNISPWRRAVVSDLTAAFDFTAPDFSWPTFPDTSQNVNMSKWECDHLPSPTIPTEQSMPTQEPGMRISRPLPYEFLISDTITGEGNAVTVRMQNTGAAGVVFFVYDQINMAAMPLKYTIEAGKELTMTWPVDTRGLYAFALYGPNGFVRGFSGSTASAGVSSSLAYDKANGAVVVAVEALAAPAAGAECSFSIVDNAYGTGPWEVSAKVGSGVAVQNIPVAASGNWYDLTVTLDPSPSCPVTSAFSRKFMGRMENGKYTTSDPAMATGMSPFPKPEKFDPVPEKYRTVEKWTFEKQCASRRSRMKDHCWDPQEDKEMRKRHQRDEL